MESAGRAPPSPGAFPCVRDALSKQDAELINLCEKLKSKDPRLASLAQTAFEEAAMWAGVPEEEGGADHLRVRELNRL